MSDVYQQDSEDFHLQSWDIGYSDESTTQGGTMSLIATERKSSLAVKLELAAISQQALSSGVTVTFEGTHGLSSGDVIGNEDYGYRTVISADTTTTCTVDSAFIIDLPANTNLKKQAYGVDPTVAAADLIEFVPPFSFEPSRDEIARNVVNRSYDEIEPVSGSEKVAGDISIELHGSGTSGNAPESDPLWQCAIGERSKSTNGATHATSACTTTVLNMVASDGAKFKAGNHVLVDPAGGTAYQVARIASIATDAITISPALSATPNTGVTVFGGIHYRPTITELHSLWAQFYRGDITIEKYKGNKCTGVTIDFRSGQTINPVFSFKGKETAAPVAGANTLGSNTADAGVVHTARYMVIKVGGTLYECSAIQIKIDNELFEQTDCTKQGLAKLIRSKRTVTGSFELMYENANIETAFRNGDVAELMVVCSTGAGNGALVAGNTFVFSCPRIKYTAVPKSSESGLYKYSVTFKASRGGTAELIEDSVFVSFL